VSFSLWFTWSGDYYYYANQNFIAEKKVQPRHLANGKAKPRNEELETPLLLLILFFSFASSAPQLKKFHPTLGLMDTKI
jgi:hypothetical protein